MPTAPGSHLPNATFQTRVRNQNSTAENPFDWKTRTTADLLAKGRVIIFALPGAFTPTCSSTHLPRYEALYDQFKAHGIDAIHCLSVNDAFVMFQWGKQIGANKVQMLPDGNGEFTRKMGMLVKKENLGFGLRSWRYALVANNGVIEALFAEDGLDDDHGADPFEVSDADTVLAWLEKVDAPKVKPERAAFEG